MSDISNVRRRAIVNSRKARARREVNVTEMWRARYAYPIDLDIQSLSDTELFLRYLPLAERSNPRLAASMRETFYHGTLEDYPSFVEFSEDTGCTALDAFFSRARLWMELGFDSSALRLISEMPDVRGEYPEAVVAAVRELVEGGDFVPPGYAAPLAMAMVDADTIVAAYLDRVPLEYAALLGSV